MSSDTARKATIRLRAAQSGENYTEARTRLSMMAKVPSLPMPIVTDPDDDTVWGELGFEDLRKENWDGDGEFRIEAKPEDTQHNNTRRAGFAVTALLAYSQYGVDPDTCISDFLSDLRHLCDALGEDFDTQSARGQNHYAAEIRGEF
jgi:hypothetical protein